MEPIIVQLLMTTGPAQILIASIWQGLLLTGSVWVLLTLAAACGFPLRAGLRFALWLVVFLLVALLPCFSLVHRVPALPSAAALSLHLNPGWAYACEALWALSSLFALARLGASAVQMRNLFVRSVPVSSDELDHTLQSIVARPGKRTVQIRLSTAIDAPSVIGFFRPAIVMPRSLWSELSTDELKQIVLHERAHLDRGDDWINLLQKLLRALCPLNPALLWAERHLCQERERACDDAVLDANGNARAYATCLTRLAETRLVRRAASLAPGLWRRHSELASRVENILHRSPALSPVFSRGLLAVCLLASLSGAFWLQHFSNLIAFTSAPQQTARTLAADGDIPSARLVLAKQTSTPSAATAPLYHDAVFHLAPKTEPLPVNKQSRATKSRARRIAFAYSLPAQFVNPGESTQEDGATITVILFTVDVPHEMRHMYRDLPTADAPAFSLSNTWIAFQI